MKAIPLYFFLVLFIIKANKLPTTTSTKAMALYSQAENHYLRKEYQKAIDCLHHVLKKDKKFIKAYLQLATVYQKLDDSVAVMASLEKALYHLPKESQPADIYYNLACLYYNYQGVTKNHKKCWLYYRIQNDTNQAAILSKINQLQAD